MSDDLIIFAATGEEHDERMRCLLERLKAKGITLNASKCTFKVTELDFFGIRIGSAGMSIQESKVSALKEAKATEC